MYNLVYDILIESVLSHNITVRYGDLKKVEGCKERKLMKRPYRQRMTRKTLYIADEPLYPVFSESERLNSGRTYIDQA